MTPAQPKLTRPQRRIRNFSRRAAIVAVLALLVLLLIIADRTGLFGRRPTEDFAKYQGRICRVVKAIDGDTFHVDIPDGKYDTTMVRLWGVDTPEIAKKDTPADHFGPQAASFTEQLTLGKQVTLLLDPVRVNRGTHGRLLAYVILPDGRMLNRLLVEQGYAYADPRFENSLRRQLADLQKHARAARLGLWADVRNCDLPDYYRDKLKLD